MYQTELNAKDSINWGRLIMMGVLPVLLCLSIFLSVFTPFPSGLSYVMYGRAKGLIASAITLVVCFLFVKFAIVDVFIFIFIIISLVIAISLAEIVIREFEPMLGIIIIGVALSLTVAGLFAVSVSQSEKTLKEQIVVEFKKIQPLLEEQKKKIQDSDVNNAFEVQALLSQPELLADKVIKEAPSYFFVGLFVVLWANLFLLLKSNRLVDKVKGKYTEMYLLNFKMPDQAIWFVIVALALVLWGDSLGEWYSTIGMTFLKTIGVFYFFQGFGIYLGFLDFIKLTGFFRSLLVVFTVFSAGQILAVVGLADMFIDFKKLMTKKDQGDL